MIEPPPEARAILQREDMAEMSIVSQIILASTGLGAAAREMRREIDVESLRFHCQRAFEEIDRQPRPEEPAALAQYKLAKFRAYRGLQLATAAIEFLAAYDKTNQMEQP